MNDPTNLNNMNDNPNDSMGDLRQIQTFPSNIPPEVLRNIISLATPDKLSYLPNIDSNAGWPSNEDPSVGSDYLKNVLPGMDSRTYIPQTETPSRGSWIQEEDDLLINAVNKIGEKKWTDIAQIIRTRTPKQCRERWMNCLRPGLKKEPFSPEEDQIIIQKQQELGNRWSAIARCLNGRSPGAVKNRWYANLKTNQTNYSNVSIVDSGIHIDPTDQTSL